MFDKENTARADTMFGDYDILETVGQGGMGVVYRAHDVALDRVVAIKVLRDDLRSQPQVVARFQREAEAFATLNHPNIVHIYSVGIVGEIPYFAMEFVEGQALSRVMKRERRIHWKRSLQIVEQIARALACAHDAHIIHRDIKPGNILLGPDDHAFVTDFGIAKVLTAETQLTLDGSRLGTPQYMSPERCQNHEITASSDIYSLGILLFQMVTGHLPYRAATPVSLIRKIVSEPPARLRNYRTDVPSDVERLVAYMIEKKPEDRPPNARTLAELVARVLAGKPLTADESDLSGALEDFRDALGAETPHVDEGGALRRGARTPFVERMWARIPSRARMLALAGMIILLSAYAGTYLAQFINSGYAIEVVRDSPQSTRAWQTSGTVADFIDESEGIILSYVNLPFFHVSGMTWVDSDHALVQLEGDRRSAREGESALIVLSPLSRSGYVAIAPMLAGDSGKALSLLTSARSISIEDGTRRGAVLLAQGAARFGESEATILQWAAGKDGGRIIAMAGLSQLMRSHPISTFSAPEITGIAVSPRGERIAMLVEDDGRSDTLRLLEGRIDGDLREGGLYQLTEVGAPIETIAYAPDGTRLVYTRVERREERSLWVTKAGRSGPGAVKIARGDFTLAEGGIRPDGRAVVVAELQNPGKRELKVLDLDSGEMLSHLGAGDRAAWRPSGESLVASAQDKRGRTQLWAIQGSEPFGRIQLTFFDEGTADRFTISQDGQWVLASVEQGHRPGLLFVSLGAIDF